VSHVPEVLKYQPVEESYAAFALYRTDIYKEADRAYFEALASAESSIDAIQANFSADMICLINLIAPDVCTFDNALPWMEAIVKAVEQNPVRVRVIVENANMNGLENRGGIDILEAELARLSLGDTVEIRFFDGRVHMKSALVDHQCSRQPYFHYSSFANGGLLEFVAATDDETAYKLMAKCSIITGTAIPADEAIWAPPATEPGDRLSTPSPLGSRRVDQV
jgi:hypothetical protein